MVLLKPGALSRERFEEIKRHPDVGESIISSMRFAPIVAPIVRHHHERSDGAGHPLGLTGESIRLAARIAAVVDAYDAMTTDRPYRIALDRAERRLRAGSREQWDRTIVDVFIDLLRLDELPAAEANPGRWHFV